jgi:catechol 2,3-dioxygenase-like lactoylglutathione lyase family enzyme
MELKRGRLIDHLHLRAVNLEATKRFYAAVLDVLGIEYTDGGSYMFADELWIDAGEKPSNCHLAFQASGPEQVGRAYEAGMAAGGRDNGAPGERNYHPGYYAGFLLDPDGNNIEFVYHGPSERSAEAVVVKAL